MARRMEQLWQEAHMDKEPTSKRQRRLDEEDRRDDARAAARCVRDGDGEHWKFQAESDEYWTPVAHLVTQIAKGNIEKDFLNAWHSGRTVCLA